MSNVRQLKSSFVRPYSIPGAPNSAGNANAPGPTDANTNPSKTTTPTSYAESLLFHKSFYFQQRRGSLDLRTISRVDVERIIREVDIDTLQSFLENITFSDLSGDDLSLYSDECFVRLFQISQLTLEYLLNVQDTLASNLDSLAQKYSRKKRELERTKQSVTAKDEEIEKLKRENRRKRKTILAYETMLRQAPAAAEAKSSASSPPGSASSPSAEIHVYVIRWFIGTCLDMTVFGSTTVLELKAKLQMLTSSTMPLHEQHISLKGVQLKDSDRLCDVSVGDESVLVLMDGEKPPAAAPAAPAPAAQPQVVVMQQPAQAQAAAPPAASGAEQEALKVRTDEMHKAALQSQAQLESAAAMLKAEIERGQEREAKMKEEMERRVKMLEDTIRTEVKQELQLQEKTSGAVAPPAGAVGAAPAPVKMSNAGELESDDEEEEVLTRTEVAARMSEAEQKAKRLENELRESVELQRKSLREAAEVREKMEQEAAEMKEAMEEAKKREEQLRIEKEQAVLQAPKQSAEVEDDEEDGPLVFADDSDDEKEGEGGGEEEKDEAKAEETKAEETKAEETKAEEPEAKEEEEKETVKLPKQWEIAFKDQKVSLDIDESSDLESVRTSLASKLNDATKEQVSFMKSVEVEVDGKLVTQSVEIKTMEELRDSYQSEKLQVGVKTIVEGGTDEDGKKIEAEEVIDFGTVASKLAKVDEAIAKFSSKLAEQHEDEDEEKAEGEGGGEGEAKVKKEGEEEEDGDKKVAAKEGEEEEGDRKEGDKVKLPGMDDKEKKKGEDGDAAESETASDGDSEKEEEDDEETKKKKEAEEKVLKKGVGGCGCKQS